jgi:hypothetical protein
MAGMTKRAGLVLTQDQEAMLKRLAGSRTAPVREIERARVLLGYAQGTRSPISRGGSGSVGRRIVLDNHPAHISKETRAYLATRPGRFEYVHTPKHGSGGGST